MKTILALLSILGVYCANGQQHKRVHTQSGVVFNVQTGGTIFYGEISRRAILPENRKNKKDFGTASSFSVQINGSNGIDTRISVLTGTLNGIRYDERGCYQRYFVNTFQEVDVTTAFDIFKNNNEFNNLTISGMVGLGVIKYRSVLRSLLTDRLISTVGYVDQKRDFPQLDASDMVADLVGIIGGTISYGLYRNFELVIEHSYRISNSSKLDAIAGKGGFTDAYSFSSFGINYKLN